MSLVDEIMFISKLFPDIGALHLLHLHVILVLLHSLLSHLFLVTSNSHFFLSLLHISLFHFLLFNECGIRLHVDWDNECCESVTPDNSSIVHNILRSDFNVFSVWVSKLLLLHYLGSSSESLWSVTANWLTSHLRHSAHHGLLLHHLHLLSSHHLSLHHLLLVHRYSLRHAHLHLDTALVIHLTVHF